MLDHFVHEGPNGSHLCIVQEFLGPSMTMKIEGNSAASKSRARRIAGQLLHAVDYLHKRGIAHGDLHTGNILLCIPASFSIDFGTPIRDTCGLPAKPSPHRPKYLVGPISERVPNKFIRSCMAKPHIKVCDFSESYMTGMTEPPPLASPHILRPPEGILGDLPYATLQTDIWGLAVVIFQILTNGGSLFSSLNDDYTLETIVLTLGKLLWRSWSNREKFFDDDVNPVLQVDSWLGLSGISSKTSLKERIELWTDVKEEILALEAMLRYDAESRCSLSDLIHCDWMVGYGRRRRGSWYQFVALALSAIMNGAEHRHIVQSIVHSAASDKSQLLKELGLDGIPSPEAIHREIEGKLLLPKTSLPRHWLPTYQLHWKPELSIPSLLTYTPSPPPTGVSFVRTGLNGRVTGHVEVPNVPPSTGLTSTSLDRAPGPSKNFVRGRSGHVPFWPGGLEDVVVSESTASSSKTGLKTIPPGFTRGLLLPDEVDESLLELGDGGDFRDDEIAAEADAFFDEQSEPPLSSAANDIDDLLPTTRSHLKPVKPSRRAPKRIIQKRDWAHVIDVNTPLSNFHELVPEMAHKYPFELDTFQKQAVYHLEMGDSVFVAAHTSAGKTVVAEYAISLAEKHMTRAIYTSPIKALSNQKFRDFKQTFSSSSVGILTGDVQINPEASCLIMTTEILRSMLYKGADLIRDVEFVIFDEVHYVNDAERGVVWEEVIIMLPDHVNIILLSATVPNTKEFADWVGRTKKKDIYVISTAQRPVPLEHYLYAGREMYKIVDSKRNFVALGYKDAGEALRRKQDKEREAAGLPPVQRVGARGAPAGQRGQQRGRGSVTPARGVARGGAPPRTMHTGADKNLYVHLVGHLRKKGLLPVVVFTFSKKRCEENAGTLSNVDLTSSVEKSEVHVAIEKALSRLKGSDKKLPQIARMRDLLSRGIGVHHGGLLPLVKEVVEILFARGLVKILFATETFAMGVNMPAKCVVFSGIRKHDGRSFRDILPGEYTQMAGRAGRRGLDATGTVIIVANDSLPEQTTLQTMILGIPTKLSSQFRLTYNMILNLLRVEALKVEEMIKRSFSENASQRLLPEQQKQVLESEKVLSSLAKLSCDICQSDIESFYDDSLAIVSANQQLFRMAVGHPQGSKLLSSGRVIILRDAHFKSNIAVLLKPAPLVASDSGLLEKSKTYFVLALVDQETKTRKRDMDLQAVTPKWPPSPNSLVVNDAVYEVTAVSLASIAMITGRTVKIDVDAIVDRHLISRMREALALLQGLVDEWNASTVIPEVDWARMRSLEFQETLRARNSRVEKLSGRECLLCGDFERHYATVHGEKVLRANIANLKLAISDQNLELIPDYEQRIAVLQELKFIDENSTVLLKGRVACEINSVNELVLTELILENTLASYEPEEVVALLSCFVFQEKTEVEPVIPPKLETGREAILAISDRVGRIQDFHKVATEDFRSSLKFGLVEVVYEWAKGMPFEQITALTDIAEGTIVRVITRLDETCREVRDAARVIGDAELFKKMEEAQIKIKRDIVFAASLYF
ncbi:ATP-dependent RNA helicase [Mycena indigotica]|uniref:ATP-dependent RNA helicase n=1 Tax=Mycena indigotica TaxID=2126181 RepID=A0A8H6SWN3_9AGAR|nr:ATP-dependent RNA helicase [Mycena indigotica]KAF7307318.1 ATP-dependent RNA helicase [Mycena indigotica]